MGECRARGFVDISDHPVSAVNLTLKKTTTMAMPNLNSVVKRVCHSVFRSKRCMLIKPFNTGISSDQYFGRGSYDPAASAEAKQRSSQFAGATAISSNAYFGREDEEEMEAEESGLLGELGGGEGVAAIERGIRDLAGKVMANPDVQNLGDSIRTGAMKVSSPYIRTLRRLTNENFLVLCSCQITSHTCPRNDERVWQWLVHCKVQKLIAVFVLHDSRLYSSTRIFTSP